MSEEIREEEMSFEEMIDASLKPVYNGKVVKGVVTAVTPSEVQVDIGTKQTGFVKLEELTNDPSAKAEELVKKGDELDLIVTKVNDQEGIVYLSKKRFDENKGKEEVAAAVESGEIMDGYVTEANSGGVEMCIRDRPGLGEAAVERVRHVHAGAAAGVLGRAGRHGRAGVFAGLF